MGISQLLTLDVCIAWSTSLADAEDLGETCGLSVNFILSADPVGYLVHLRKKEASDKALTLQIGKMLDDVWNQDPDSGSPALCWLPAGKGRCLRHPRKASP